MTLNSLGPWRGDRNGCRDITAFTPGCLGAMYHTFSVLQFGSRCCSNWHSLILSGGEWKSPGCPTCISCPQRVYYNIIASADAIALPFFPFSPLARLSVYHLVRTLIVSPSRTHPLRAARICVLVKMDGPIVIQGEPRITTLVLCTVA